MFFYIMEGAMKPVELVGNLAAGAASMSFPPSSLVFGAVTYLINAAKGVTASYDAIQDLMQTLKVCYSFHGDKKRPCSDDSAELHSASHGLQPRTNLS